MFMFVEAIPEHTAGMHWPNVIAASALVVTILSLVLGVFFKLLKSNIITQFQLSSQKAEASADLLSERQEATVKRFEDRIDVVKAELQRLLDDNREADHEAYDRLALQLETTNRKLESLDKDYRKFLANLPLAYVQRDDWIREFNKVDAKLDAIWNKLNKTSEKVAKETGK